MKSYPRAYITMAPIHKLIFDSSPFVVNYRQKAWPRTTQVRRAGVSSLGLGGTNVHVVLEEAPTQVLNESQSHSAQLLLLSTKSEAALERATQNLSIYLKKNPGVNSADLAYTLQMGRKAFAHRRFIVSDQLTKTQEVLQQGQNYFSNEGQLTPRELVFMFPGGGAQHRNMGRGLYDQHPVFRQAIDRCLYLLEQNHNLDLREMLYPKDTNIATPIENPLHGISLLFAVEYATAQLWLSWGLQPAALIGHSLGEYTAACIAGVLQLEDALALVAKRGKLFGTLPRGGMLSIPLPEEENQNLAEWTSSSQFCRH